jgi:hypothetical protein
VPAGLVQASAGALPFGDAVFGLVVSTVSFHHLCADVQRDDGGVVGGEDVGIG